MVSFRLNREVWLEVEMRNCLELVHVEETELEARFGIESAILKE